jgi:prolipoprotein diacylglyceryltransferase
VIAGYSLGRFFIELIRTDEANRILGLRVNTWVSALIIVLGIVVYTRSGRAPASDDDATLSVEGPVTETTPSRDAE